MDKLASEAVDLLKEMIAIPSPSFSEDAVCTQICRWLAGRAIPYARKGNNIICRNQKKSEKPMLMLCAHIDTVSPSEG